MVTEFTRNGITIYAHTAWADDEGGTNFSLEEYEDAIYAGSYVSNDQTSSEDPETYAWARIDNEMVVQTEQEDDELETDEESEEVEIEIGDEGAGLESDNGDLLDELMEDLEDNQEEQQAAIEEVSNAQQETQNTSDVGIGNPNELAGTNQGTSGWTASAGLTMAKQSGIIYSGNDKPVDYIQVTCNTAGNNYIKYNADALRAKLAEDTSDNSYTFSCDVKMSELFIIPSVDVKDLNGGNKQIGFDQIDNEPRDDEDIDNTNTWLHHCSTGSPVNVVISEETVPVDVSDQALIFDLSEMTAGTILCIANLKIEEGALETPWRRGTDELEKQIAAVEDSISELEGRVETAEGALTEIEGDISALDTRVETAEGALTEIEGDIGSLDTRVETAEGNLSEMEGEISELQPRVESLETDLERAEGDIAAAQDAAETAGRAANGALAGLATLENVVDTVNWFADHKKASTDTSVVTGKNYYIYDSQTGTLSLVTPEGTENPAQEGWFELDEAISEYVASHVAETSDGLWVIGLSNGWKVLVSSGAGNYLAGIFLIDPSGNIAQATTANGISFDSDKPFYIGDESAYITFDGNGHINIAGTGVTIGGSKALTSLLSDLGASLKAVEYGVGSSNTSHSDITSWSSATPEWQAGKYIWMRTTTNGLTYTYTCIQGAKGDTGATGATGATGPEAVVTVYPSQIDWEAGTATLAVTLRVNGTVTTPSSYKWTKGSSTTSLGTDSTLAVTDLDAVYNCTVTW